MQSSQVSLCDGFVAQPPVTTAIILDFQRAIRKRGMDRARHGRTGFGLARRSSGSGEEANESIRQVSKIGKHSRRGLPPEGFEAGGYVHAHQQQVEA